MAKEKKLVERVQTGVRLEKRLLRVLQAMTDEAFAAEMVSWKTAITKNDNAIHDWLASRN